MGVMKTLNYGTSFGRMVFHSINANVSQSWNNLLKTLYHHFSFNLPRALYTSKGLEDVCGSYLTIWMHWLKSLHRLLIDCVIIHLQWVQALISSVLLSCYASVAWLLHCSGVLYLSKSEPKQKCLYRCVSKLKRQKQVKCAYRNALPFF